MKHLFLVLTSLLTVILSQYTVTAQIVIVGDHNVTNPVVIPDAALVPASNLLMHLRGRIQFIHFLFTLIMSLL
jgi:cell division septal protein FtsQ